MKEEKKILLILGSHAHVPCGAPESEFEYVYENKMRPFVSNLYRYSNIQAVLHYSGILLNWVERNHPEFFMLIEDMVTRKQVEILGGGFYDPIFTIIPAQDRIGQIELMTTYLRKHFGRRPQGCWIPGFIWEQHLAASLSSSDMNFTFLSQDQFEQAGLRGAQLFLPCISEDQGKLIVIFPVSLSVENALKEKSFSLVFVELKNKFEQDGCFFAENKIVSIFPEKIFSSAANCAANCAAYGEEAPDSVWNRLFEEISLSESIVETILPAKMLRNHMAYNKCSFPNSSSFGNNFSVRRFLIEHEEAGGIYSKMIFTNALIGQIKGDKYRKQNAREELWKAQDSCLYSPGSSQLRGILRKAAYSSLLRAERLSREKGKFISSLIQHDFNFDGIKEYLFQDFKINFYIRQQGAVVFELDYLPKDWNYLDCGSCGGVSRTAFADAFFSIDLKIENNGNYQCEKSRFCFNELYEAAAQDKKGKSCFKLHGADNIPFGNIEINKCYLLKKDVLSVSYSLKNCGREREFFNFIPEIVFSFAGIGDDFVRFYSGDAVTKDIHLDRQFTSDYLKILDVKNEVQIVLSSANVFSGNLIPAFNGEFCQAARILPVFSITLESGQTWTNEFSLKFSH